MEKKSNKNYKNEKDLYIFYTNYWKNRRPVDIKKKKFARVIRSKKKKRLTMPSEVGIPDVVC